MSATLEDYADLFEEISMRENRPDLRVINAADAGKVAALIRTETRTRKSHAIRYNAMREALAELLLAVEAERQAVAAFLDNHQDRAKRDEYRTAMYAHRANRARAESRARDLLAKYRGEA